VLHEIADPRVDLLHGLVRARLRRRDAVAAGADLLVLPVRRDAALGDGVHLLGADLDLDGPPVRAEHRGVEALVAVGLRDGDEVAEALRDRLVEVRQDGVDAPAVLAAFLALALEHDADREEVVDLVEPLLLALHLPVDGGDALRAAVDREREPGLLQFLPDRLDEGPDELLALLPGLVEPARDLAVGLGLDVFEAEVLELGLHLVEPEAVRERHEEVLRLARDLELLALRERVERAHVVEAVGELDQDDADVRRHREHELADVLGLREVARLEDVVDLREAVHDGRHRGAELGLDQLQREVRVLDRVVEERRRDGHVVERDVLGDDGGDFEGVRDVALAGGAAVVAVGPVGDPEGAAEHRLVHAGEAAPAVLEEDAEPPFVGGLDVELVELGVEVFGGLDHGRYRAYGTIRVSELPRNGSSAAVRK